MLKFSTKKKETPPYALENASLEKQVKKRFRGPLNWLLFVFWVGLLFVTHLTHDYSLGIHKIFEPLARFFIIKGKTGFPGLELTGFILFAFIFYIFRDAYEKPNSLIRVFFGLSVLFVFLALINPKNYFGGFIKFFTFRITRTIIIYIIVAFVVMFLRTKVFAAVMVHVLNMGIKIGLAKATFDLLVYLSGVGIRNTYGRRIASYGGEVLTWYAIFHAILLALYIYTRKKKYLYAGSIFFLCILFTYARSPIYLILMADSGLFMVAALKFKMSLRPLLKIGYAIAAMFFILFFIAGKSFLSDLLQRYGSAIEFTGLVEIKGKGVYSDYTDTGHVNQALKVTRYFLANTQRFWGGGLNRRDENYLFLEGQAQGGVHSNVASMWQFFGIPGVCYLLEMFLFFLLLLIKLLGKKKLNSFENYLCLVISIYFIARFITGWFAGDYFFMYLQLGIQYIFLISLLKLYDQKIFKQVLNRRG